MLLRRPILYGNSCPYCSTFRYLSLWSPEGLEDLSLNFGFSSTGASDIHTLQLADGRILSFGLGGVQSNQEFADGKKSSSWNGPESWKYRDSYAVTVPPVAAGDAIYIGITHKDGSMIYMSVDEGESWTYKETNSRIGDDRYNLVASPEQDALWAIFSEYKRIPGSLWESYDHGANWSQVDNGSFPANTVRVVHDPADTQVSYALTDHGLFVSRNRGVSWQSTSFTEAVHGLVFVDQVAPLSRAMVVGTDRGISVSVDDGATWSDMSNGLFEGPHTVTYSDGQLLATGDEGYFTCNGLDCAGLAMPIPPEEALGMVEVTEYYNTILDHYFITGMDGEKALIDQGQAGPGWDRTGESFLGWNLRSNPNASNVCRFYGSYVLGPNSHFYSDTAMECRLLQELQEATPDDKPRWNLEGWAMSVLPRAENDQQPCPENAKPVYRAYNNGYALGKDSNHRYITNPALLTEMEAKGWINEGIAFCAPNESSF